MADGIALPPEQLARNAEPGNGAAAPVVLGLLEVAPDAIIATVPAG